MYKDKVFLASGSPRRHELMALAFNDLERVRYAADEPRWVAGTTYIQYLTHCVNFKWDAACAELSSRKLPARSAMLVADTIVVLGKEVLGKPDTPAEARKMLRKLSGREHRVYTALRLGLHHSGKWHCEDCVEETRVRFYSLTDKEIAAYVRTGEPMDKAGAYGFQDRALTFVERIEGSYLNVVGLPMERVRAAAESLGLR